MPGRKRREEAADLSRASVRFERWRVRRARGARIPATLWKSAVKLAGRHGASRVATALKLDYYALKGRLERGKGVRNEWHSRNLQAARSKRFRATLRGTVIDDVYRKIGDRQA